ncbi:MAG: sugar-binding domain-containing protein [Bacteroidota bacterium]
MKQIFISIFIVALFISCQQKHNNNINLSGEWQFRIDPDDIGEKENWFNADYNETVQLPGSMVENGKGYDISLETEWTGGMKNPEWHKHPSYAPYHDSTNIRFPYWLQPDKKYTGAAWYRKKVIIPERWKGKNVWLSLERPHWESTVWINGIKLAPQNSLATPHIFDISEYVFAEENTVAIRIDNRTKDVDVGRNSHSISDHTQSNWNGIVGDISLKTTGHIYFDNIEVFPDIETKTVKIIATLINATPSDKSLDINVKARLKGSDVQIKSKKFTIKSNSGKNIITLNYPFGKDALLWDEFNPNVYELTAELEYKGGVDKKTIDFGLREFKAGETSFSINNRPVFLRGTLECAIFPKTGYPPTDVEGWKKVYNAAKAHGLNHIRFHSWCPPEAAFIAADEMGIYLQVECSSWANQSTRLGSGEPIDQYIWDESKRIVKNYGNHPSFVMMAYGNEPRGPKHKKFLTEFVTYWQQTDNRRIYTSGAGWPVIPENDFHCTHQNVRIQGWGEGLNSIINSQPPRTDYDWTDGIKEYDKPLVSHEIGQWCVYPNFKEIEKYTGPLKAKNFELFRESLTANHMGNLAKNFLMASGKLQTLCYKADIEAALRTPGFGGFQLLDLHDFPGQGTALVGVLDPFWEEKGYISPEEYSRFCNSTVPLSRLEKRIFKENETMTAGIEVAHFGAEPLNTNPAWKIIQNNKIIAEGTLGQKEISIGNGIELGNVVYKFQKENQPRKLTLEVSVDEFSNSWDIWVYPENKTREREKVKVVEKLTPSTIKYLNDGGKILLSLGKRKVAPEMGGDIGVGFSSIFWNTAWTNGQKPHTLGILCNPEHPALEQFPTEYHSNWQWWDAMNHSDAIKLNGFPVELKPIIRIIDDWVTNRRLALLFEAKVGEGKILVSGVDLVNDLPSRLEAQQLKTSLLNYMDSQEFNPGVELTVKDIQKIIK